MPTQPNLLYVFADQMRAGAMGCMNDSPFGSPGEAVRTPNLDRLAAEGELFTHAYANTPVCTPSRASLLTGRHALTCRTVANDLRLPEEERSIADVLKRRGYRCGYVGKWHLDGISRHQFTPPGRRRHGFDDCWAAYNCNHNYFDAKWYEGDSPELRRQPGYDADVQTDQAIGFIERCRDEPFCLFLSWGPPHDPYRMVPQEFLDLYPPEGITLQPNVEGADRAAIAGYYAHVTALDRNVGRLMETLDRLGLAEDTLVVFSSDHGDMLWSHGRCNKQQPYEESIHIPLIMRWPERLPAGQVSDLLIGVVDHAPTLLGLLGVGPAEAMNGLDLSAHVLGRLAAAPTSVFLAEHATFDQDVTWQPWRGVRTSRYTYARWLQGGTLLFDNLEDPYQMCNLAHKPAYRDLLESLERELQGWLARLGDRFVSGEEHLRETGRWEEWLIRQEHFHGTSARNW
jgi:arylsulfatase A-like enzyme